MTAPPNAKAPPSAGDVALGIASLPGTADGSGGYPEFPFDPGRPLPELPGRRVGGANPVHAAVREALALLGLDAGHFDTPKWNPLGEIIHPGQRVLLKPNWVYHENRGEGGLLAMVTHTSVLRAVIDYVLLALRGEGRLVIGDAPIQSADFQQIRERLMIDRLLGELDGGGVTIEVRDFRRNVCQVDAKGRVVGHRDLAGDPEGYCTVDLGPASMLSDIDGRSGDFRVTNYDPAAMRSHHAPGRHEYLIARAVLESDVVINVPKLKTHRKAGLTGCLKNVVGINGSKDYLPHHRLGAARGGGDEYEHGCLWKAMGSRLTDRIEAAPSGPLAGPERLALRFCHRMARHFARDSYSEGSWFGNDTVWRTAMDLNRVLACARPDGTLSDQPRRTIFNVVDAVVVGAGEGPLRPDAALAGMVLAGRSQSAVDNCAARLVGLDPRRIPLLRNSLEQALAQGRGSFRPCLVTGRGAGERVPLDQVRPRLCIKPPAGWAGHVELADPCGPPDDSSRRTAQAPVGIAEE